MRPRPEACLYCGAPFALEYGHWRLCGVCSADFIASLKPKPPRDRVMEIHRERERFRQKQGAQK